MLKRWKANGEEAGKAKTRDRRYRQVLGYNTYICPLRELEPRPLGRDGIEGDFQQPTWCQVSSLTPILLAAGCLERINIGPRNLKARFSALASRGQWGDARDH